MLPTVTCDQTTPLPICAVGSASALTVDGVPGSGAVSARERGDPLATAGRELLRIGGHVSPCATGLTQLALCADLLRQLHTPVMRSAGSDWPTDVARPVNRAA